MLLLTPSPARAVVLVSLLALTASARPVHDHELAPLHRHLGPRQGLLGKLFGGGDDNDTTTAQQATSATGSAEQTSAGAGGGGATTTTQAVASPPTTSPVQQARTTTTVRQATSPTTAAADQVAKSVSSAPAPSASSAPSASGADPSSSPTPSASVPVSADPISSSSSAATEVQKAAVQQTALNAGTTVTQIISSSAPGSTTPVTANHLQAASPSPLSPANSLFPLVISGIVIGALLALALVFLLVKRVIIPSSRKSSRWDADLPWQSDDPAGSGVGGARPWSVVGSVHDGPGVGRSGSTRSAREQMSEVGNGYPAAHRGIASSEAFGYGGGYDGGHYDHDARVLGAVDAYRVGPNPGQEPGWGHGPPMEPAMPAMAAMPPPMYENGHARDMGLRDEKGRLV